MVLIAWLIIITIKKMSFVKLVTNLNKYILINFKEVLFIKILIIVCTEIYENGELIKD